MRRTGQNRRRTGQREGNRGNLTTESTEDTEDEVLQRVEPENRFFRQDDPPTKRQLRRDEAESERSGERLL